MDNPRRGTTTPPTRAARSIGRTSASAARVGRRAPPSAPRRVRPIVLGGLGPDARDIPPIGRFQNLELDRIGQSAFVFAGTRHQRSILLYHFPPIDNHVIQDVGGAVNPTLGRGRPLQLSRFAIEQLAPIAAV